MREVKRDIKGTTERKERWKAQTDIRDRRRGETSGIATKLYVNERTGLKGTHPKSAGENEQKKDPGRKGT